MFFSSSKVRFFALFIDNFRWLTQHKFWMKTVIGGNSKIISKAKMSGKDDMQWEINGKITQFIGFHFEFIGNDWILTNSQRILFYFIRICRILWTEIEKEKIREVWRKIEGKNREKKPNKIRRRMPCGWTETNLVSDFFWTEESICVFWPFGGCLGKKHLRKSNIEWNIRI